MSNRFYKDGKIDLKPKKHHGYAALLFILGTLFPPLAVAARFGIGGDFWLNLLLTVCGYIPGHGHNFYIQNIRNNKTNRRTPKWAQRYGLIDTSEIQRKQKKSQWANRYNDRNPHSALEGQEYEEGQVPDRNSQQNLNGNATQNGGARNGELWGDSDESFYNRDPDRASTNSSSRWHYPANFEDADPMPGTELTSSKKKKVKKDRFARTEDAYSYPQDSSRKKKKKSKRKNHSAVGDAETFDTGSASTADFPEDPDGGLYGRSERSSDNLGSSAPTRNRVDDGLNHEF